MELKEELIAETKRWLEKIAAERTSIERTPDNSDFIKNIDAYIADATYFLQQEEYIEAFEAVIWAWAYLEIGREKGML